MKAFQAPSFINRYQANPVLSSRQIPYPATLVFNPAVVKHGGRYVIVFRNDFGDEQKHRLDGTSLGLAFSSNGTEFKVTDRPCCLTGLSDDVVRVYDPRLTIVNETIYLCFAVDTRHGVCGGIAVTQDFVNYRVLHVTAPDNRNLVLFPQKIADRFVRLERPFPVYSRGGEQFDIWMSFSPDLEYWGHHKLVLGAEDVPYCNSKIGPGPAPILTEAGWLLIFHAVHFDPNRPGTGWDGDWKKLYMAGAMLLDTDDPSRVIAVSQQPLMLPQADYELEGYRGNTVFPTAAVLEDDEEVKIYYGAADTVVGLATAQLGDIIDFIKKT